jgi:CRISPR-associated protein Cas5t
MLLSMVGEINRRTHEGAEVAIAVMSIPAYSVVLRTLWRVKKKALGPGLGENRRPDFQELLTYVDLAVWV